ncbi:MAG: hypothetical protein NWQ31_01270 [Polaribacter sp.]|nr:hypothetical protein [Polaribacter sp.]
MKSVTKYKTDLNYLIKLNNKIDYKDLDYRITKNNNNSGYKLWTRFKTGYSLDFEFEKINGKYVLVCVHP